MTAIEIKVVADTATAAIADVTRRIGDPAARKVIGQIAAETYRAHLYQLNRQRPNKLGGPRTKYWAKAADATTWVLHPDGAKINIAHTGIRLHYHGGEVRPVTAKNLAIPATPAAHGTRPIDSQWRGKLEVAFIGGRRLALVATQNFDRTITRGKNAGQRRRSKKTEDANAGLGEVVFWLVKKVTIQPDPTILPTDDSVLSRIATALRRYLTAKS